MGTRDPTLGQGNNMPQPTQVQVTASNMPETSTNQVPVSEQLPQETQVQTILQQTTGPGNDATCLEQGNAIQTAFEPATRLTELHSIVNQPIVQLDVSTNQESGNQGVVSDQVIAQESATAGNDPVTVPESEQGRDFSCL